MKVGQEILLKVQDKLIAGITSHDFQAAVDMLETTNMNTTGKNRTFISGRSNLTMSCEALHDPQAGVATMNDFFSLLAIATAGTPATLYWGGSAAGDKYIEASGLINSISNKSQDNAVPNWSCSFQVSGDFEVKTVA
jgi:hypothetical protein